MLRRSGGSPKQNLLYVIKELPNVIIRNKASKPNGILLRPIDPARIGPVSPKQLNEIPSPIRVEDRYKQRRVPVFVGRIDDCSGLEQHLGDLHVPLLRRQMERSEAVTVPEVRVLPCRQERTGLAGGALERTVMQL